MSINTAQVDKTSTTVGKFDMKLEVVTIPVSEIERAKEFYECLGWRLDADASKGDERVVQFTPPGSPCSIHFRKGVTPAETGTLQSLYLIVSDVQAAREELVGRGVRVSEVFHYTGGPARFGGKVGGPAPDRLSYGSYATFTDPDGNDWLLQEVTTRLPGRIDPAATSFGSVSDLAAALRRAAAAHNEHEKRVAGEHADWPEWYAAYLTAEQAGAELPS